MKKRVVAILMATVVAVGLLAGCGSKGENGGEASTEEGKVINIYSWNDEFRERLEAVYPEVESTSQRWNCYNIERWNRDPLDHQSKSGWCLSAET